MKGSQVGYDAIDDEWKTKMKTLEMIRLEKKTRMKETKKTRAEPLLSFFSRKSAGLIADTRVNDLKGLPQHTLTHTHTQSHSHSNCVIKMK